MYNLRDLKLIDSTQTGISTSKMLTPGIIERQCAFSNVFQFYISLIRINKSQTRDLKIYNALFPDFKFLQDFSSVIKGFLPRSFRLSFRSVSVHLFFFRVPRLLFFTSRPPPPPCPHVLGAIVLLCMSSNFLLLRYVSMSRLLLSSTYFPVFFV